HHVPARRRAAQFHETEMPLGNLRAHGKIELRQAPVPTPPAQARCESLLPRHVYLPGSCANAAVWEDATSRRGETQEIGVERVDWGCDRAGVELPRQVGSRDDALSRWRRRSDCA